MILIHVNTDSVLLSIAHAQEQSGHMMRLALNRLANDVQAAEREGLKKHFRLRREAWNLKGIKIEKADRATKTTWRVVIQIAPTTDYLNKFEEGGEKMPTKGKFVWVPSPVFKSRIIGRGEALHPKKLTFTRTPAGQMKGNERTFMVRTPRGPLVIQRVDSRLNKKGLKKAMSMTMDTFMGGQGPARKGEKYSLKRTAGTRLLYTLKARVRIKARLQFIPIARQVVDANWEMHMEQAFNEAMRGAR